jgi:hypothetical protein
MNESTTEPVPPKLDGYICKNCGHEGKGNFCSECGEERISGNKINPLRTCHQILSHIIDLDFKWFYSLRVIFTRPGQATLDFIEGRRVRHAHPIVLFAKVSAAYLFLGAAFHPIIGVTHMILDAFSQIWTGIGLSFDYELVHKSGLIVFEGEAGRANIGGVTAFEGFIVAGSLISGFCLFCLFARRRRAIAEHLVMGLHLACFNLIVIGLVSWAITFVPFSKVVLPILLLLGIDFIYFQLAAKRVYNDSWGILTLKWFVLQIVMLAYIVFAAISLTLLLGLKSAGV